MDPDKVMEDPVDIEALLEPFFLFGVGVGFSAIGRTPPAQGGIEGFQMIGTEGQTPLTPSPSLSACKISTI